MNSIQLLAFLLVVLGGGTFSSAAMSNSFKSFEKKSIGRDRRDLTDFQTQLKAATTINIADSAVCPTVPCVSTMDQSWCPSFCSADSDLFNQILTSVITCYMNGLCEKSLSSFTLSNVNISIAPGSYEGNCFLHGDQVTVTLNNPPSDAYKLPAGISYDFAVALEYVFNGLSLRCQPTIISQNCSPTGTSPTGTSPTGTSPTGTSPTGTRPTGTSPTGTSQSVGLPCCGNSLLNQLICLVQQLVGSLGVNLYILSCNCNCGGASSWGKRQPADSTAFDIPVTVTQYDIFHDFVIFSLTRDYRSIIESLSVDTDVSFGSPIPSQYATDITNGIKTVFTDYNTGYKLQYNFDDILSSIVYRFMKTCPSC